MQKKLIGDKKNISKVSINEMSINYDRTRHLSKWGKYTCQHLRMNVKADEVHNVEDDEISVKY